MYYIEERIQSMNSSSDGALVLAIIWIIINDYARWTISPLLISQYANDVVNHWQHEDTVQEILKQYAIAQNKIDGPMMKLLLEGDNLFASKNRTAHTYQMDEDTNEDPIYYKTYYKKENAIWFVDSLKSFGRLKKDLMNDKKYYHRNGFFTMVYTGVEQRFQNIKIIFRELFQIYVTNINIIFSSKDSTIVYTYYPFKSNKCHSSEPEFLLDMTSIDAIPDKFKFFRNKVNNMFGCQMLITTWHQEPFIYLPADNSTQIQLHGIEGNLFHLLAERINFTYSINAPANLTRGEIFPNKTATGAFGMLVQGETNFTVNAYMYEKRRSDVALATYSYYSCSLAVAIPKGRQMSAFERLVKPFKYRIWIILSCSIILAIIIICFVKLCYPSKVQHFLLGYRNQIPFTNLWLTFYGGPVNAHLPGTNFARFLLSSWIIYTFVMRSAYVSELYYILQDGRARMALNSIAEAVSQNYTFITPPVVARILENALGTPNIEFMYSDFNETQAVLANLQKSSDRYVLVILKEIVLAFNQRIAHSSDPIPMLAETVATAPITIYMRKHTYLKHHVDELLILITSSGIVSKYSKLFINKRAKFDDNAAPVALSMPLLAGAFNTYLMLLALCFLIFICEIFAQRYRFLRRLLNFFNL